MSVYLSADPLPWGVGASRSGRGRADKIVSLNLSRPLEACKRLLRTPHGRAVIPYPGQADQTGLPAGARKTGTRRQTVPHQCLVGR